MLKEIFRKISYLLWWGFFDRAKRSNTNFHTFVKTRHQRNDDEIELENRLNDDLYLERFGFKVYSQNDEDGIIEEIFNRIKTTNKCFVEFGVQNGLESNCHYLLHKGWHGLWIEGNKKSSGEIKNIFKKVIENKRLVVINGFITKDNINSLISEQGKINGEIDLLSIDIDGNDYWVWEAISCIKPRVVVIEYNAKFPPNYEWTMEYDAKHIWHGDDEQGASLKSLELLGARIGGGVSTGRNKYIGSKCLFCKDRIGKRFVCKTGHSRKII